MRRRSAFDRAGSGFGEEVDQRLETIGKGFLHHHTAAGGVGAERREDAALPGLVAMARLKIMREQSGVGIIGGFGRGLFPVRRRLRRHLPAGLRDEIVLRIEMAVKAAMGEIGGFHDVGDADAAKTVGAQQRAGRIDDALAVLGGLLPAYSHHAPQLCSPTTNPIARLTNYMTIDINRQAAMMAVI